MSSLTGTAWDGLALRRLRAAPEPDEPTRAVALPAAWDEGAEEAAAALAGLAPGNGPVSLARLAEAWISRLVRQGESLELLSPEEADVFAADLRTLLLARRGAPGIGTWRGDAKLPPRFVLNLPAFLDGTGGFNADGYAEAVALAVRALDIMGGGKALRLSLGFADLAGLLAGFGLAYDSAEGRAAGAAVAALTRGAAEAESGRLAERFGAREPLMLIWPAPPRETPVPGLAEAAHKALDEAAASFHGLRHAALLTLSPADAVEAVLGAETGGLAPAPGPSVWAYGPDGEPEERPTRAARRAGARAAELLAPVGSEARQAMERAVVPFLHAMAPQPVAEAAPPRPVPAARPVAPTGRQTGATWRATVGGHRVVLRTTEDAAGRPLELAISLSKEAAAYRSLMDAFAHSVSLGLASGTPLESYVDAFAYTRFGPAGTVEGDPAFRRATSVLDWAFRRLALEYLGRRDLADPSEEDLAPDALGRGAAEHGPLLPLELPDVPSPRARRRALRIVA